MKKEVKKLYSITTESSILMTSADFFYFRIKVEIFPLRVTNKNYGKQKCSQLLLHRYVGVVGMFFVEFGSFLNSFANW